MGIEERKEREREQRRNDIIDAAERVFFSKGIENASMDEVASEAELSKGTIYLYFKSKEELLFAINIRAIIILQEKIEKVVDPAKNTIDNIIAIGYTYVLFSREYKDYFEMLLYFEGSAQFNVMHEMYEKFFTEDNDPMLFLARMLEKGIHDGSIRDDIPSPVLAHCLWSQVTGVLRLIKAKDLHIDLKEYSEDEIIDTHLKIMLYGILKTS